MPCEVAVVARVFTPNGRKKDCRNTCRTLSNLMTSQHLAKRRLTIPSPCQNLLTSDASLQQQHNCKAARTILMSETPVI